MIIPAALRHTSLALAELWSAVGGAVGAGGFGQRGQQIIEHQHPYSSLLEVTSLLPRSGNALWYREPASNLSTWSTEWLPIGNGYLGGMVTSGTTDDIVQLNLETFWSGGPFVNESYTGGNRQEVDAIQLVDQLHNIRQRIFKSKEGETDSVAPLTYPGLNYGSFSGNGFLITSRNSTIKAQDYIRWLDLDSGFLRSSWKEGKDSFSREYFCSYPTKSCTSYLKTDAKDDKISYSFVPLKELKNTQVSCLDQSTLQYRGQSVDSGMTYEILAKVQTNPPNLSYCHVTIEDGKFKPWLSHKGAQETWITWVGNTNYDINAGDVAHDFSFRGVDPHHGLVRSLQVASALSYQELRQMHSADYEEGVNAKFALSLGAEPDFSRSTKEQVKQYSRHQGNAHLEWVLFNYGRYMLFSSARGVLPSNLQGVWAKDIYPPWSADYHANINTQMNYWGAEITDIDVTDSLWDYMAKTWIPRGEQTANILYNTRRGWVTHNEMNIFGHTGMKSLAPWNSAQWANYPAAGAWMMIQVIDHLDYGSGSIDWWQKQGWPLVKEDNLFVDTHTNDGTMVVNPCNSPEQAPITFGCAHFQQLIWEVFNGIEKGFEYSGDTDVAFLAEVRAKKARIDRGLHIGSWGQLQEWKVEKDNPKDLHRHLSHLVGLYPSYSIASYPEGGEVPGLSREDLLEAARSSLHHRGEGTGPDADAGWEKVWRAACWAQLGDSERFYSVFKYSVFENFGYNLFSLYDPLSYDPIFQIDANLGVPGVVMNAILQAPDTSSYDSPLVINILPALPKAWANKGSVRGARVRGGIGISFAWQDGVPSDIVLTFDRTRIKSRLIEVQVQSKPIESFIGQPGVVRRVKTF